MIPIAENESHLLELLNPLRRQRRWFPLLSPIVILTLGRHPRRQRRIRRIRPRNQTVIVPFFEFPQILDPSLPELFRSRRPREVQTIQQIDSLSRERRFCGAEWVLAEEEPLSNDPLA